MGGFVGAWPKKLIVDPNTMSSGYPWALVGKEISQDPGHTLAVGLQAALWATDPKNYSTDPKSKIIKFDLGLKKEKILLCPK